MSQFSVYAYHAILWPFVRDAWIFIITGRPALISAQIAGQRLVPVSNIAVLLVYPLSFAYWIPSTIVTGEVDQSHIEVHRVFI